MIRRYAPLAALLLAGCLQQHRVDIPYTSIVIPEPDYPNTRFITTAEVNLRKGLEDETGVVAVLPEGTPVEPILVGSECNCWKVATPNGVGWLYKSYIKVRNYTSD